MCHLKFIKIIVFKALLLCFFSSCCSFPFMDCGPKFIEIYPQLNTFNFKSNYFNNYEIKGWILKKRTPINGFNTAFHVKLQLETSDSISIVNFKLNENDCTLDINGIESIPYSLNRTKEGSIYSYNLFYDLKDDFDQEKSHLKLILKGLVENEIIKDSFLLSGNFNNKVIKN